ncbi:hypothetical protein EAY71_24665 [Vibrio anguillarum]|uniref:hypothetical protein n=1 Tax=Vibrio anguillarum TaxID=55601 RepID=UPI00188CA957|nr:hypothetical protein [Vibrio anguillarum]MBF4270056.1 hypothetical protein [Vibrio anguillarum]
MSGHSRCSLYVSNLTDTTCIAMKPTDVQSHVISGPSNVEPRQEGHLVVKTKGTSGTATGSHVTERLYLQEPDGTTQVAGYIEVSISCPFSSDNGHKVTNTTPYQVIHQLRSKSGEAVVDLVIRDISNDYLGEE